MTGSAPQTFYRVVLTDPPTEVDFMSNQAKGKPRRAIEGEEEWRGISVFTRLERAREIAHKYPQLGSFIAELRIPPDAPIGHDQPSWSGHCNLWGTPEELGKCVTSVAPA